MIAEQRRTTPSMTDPRPWSYRFHVLDTAPEAFGTFGPMVDLWRDRAGPRALPRWADLDFDAFAGWHDMMVLDEIAYDPFDARTVIWGSRLAELTGYQPRGRLLSESRAMRGLLDEDFAFLERICRESCFGMSRGQLDWRGRDHIAMERLYLPFAPADDAAVDRVASFCRIVEANR